jgi:hypothetical protein
MIGDLPVVDSQGIVNKTALAYRYRQIRESIEKVGILHALVRARS